MIIRFPPGMRPDSSSEFSLQGLMSNTNAYAEEWVAIASDDAGVVLTPAQVIAKNIVFTAGATGLFTVLLPSTSTILDALGPTIARDGSFWFPFYIANQISGQNAQLFAGDPDTTVNDGIVADGHVGKWMVNVVPQSDPMLPLTLVLQKVFDVNAGSNCPCDQPTVDLTGNVDTEIALGFHVFYRFLTGDMTLTDPTWAAAAPTNATPFEGYTILFIFEQDVTGAHNVTAPSNFMFPDGFPSAIAQGSKAFTVWTGVYYGSIGAGTDPLNGWLVAVPTQFAAR